VSDAAASDDSGGEPVAAAADAFDLSSAVKHVHSRFNKCQTTTTTRDQQASMTEHGRVSDDDGHVWK